MMMAITKNRRGNPLWLLHTGQPQGGAPTEDILIIRENTTQNAHLHVFLTKTEYKQKKTG